VRSPAPKHRIGTPLVRLVVVAAMALAAFAALTASPASAAPGNVEMDFLTRLNQVRVANGVAPLVFDQALSDTSTVWAAKMAADGHISHDPTVPDSCTYATPAWTRCGENVGVGPGVSQLHDAFVASTGHFHNMIGDYNRVGIGTVVEPGGRIWVTVRFVKGPAIAGPTGLEPHGPGGFTDTAGNTHGANIAKVATAGITGGYPDGTFRPDGYVSRAQMAAFLQRAIHLPDANGRTFPDVIGSVHEPAVRAVAAAGITTGDANGNYRPGDIVTRGQLAAFLVRAEHLPLGGGPSFCDTAGHAFEREIRALAAAGVATGNGGCFDPNAPVNRAQMATFLSRALHL
jgi:hypothetical protein